MWLVLVLAKFEFEPAGYPLPIRLDPGKMIGFSPIYETKEDALEEYPDAKLMEIKEVKE